MARRLRHDEPGAWFHVTNRGVARRTMFERRADYRFFLSRVARAVRAGLIEVHAYSLLTTHFHLLVRSPVGELSTALHRIQNSYSRHFNRGRRRDGPLVRGRFFSKRIDCDDYWSTVLRYIDDNPLEAGLTDDPTTWPYGSASHYVRPAGPIWLSREHVEASFAPGDTAFDPETYRAHCTTELTDARRRLVDARLRAACEANDPIGDLVGASSAKIRSWMRYKARLADGTAPGLPVVDANTLAEQLAAAEPRETDGRPPSRLVRRRWSVLAAGLFRFGAGLTFREIGARLGVSETTAWLRLRAYPRAAAQDDELVEAATAAFVAALRSDWPTAVEVDTELPVPT